MGFTPSATMVRIDHLVLTVRSIKDSAAWYETNLGMIHQETGDASDPNPNHIRHSVWIPGFKINLHEVGNEFEPKATTAAPGTADLCFITNDALPDVLTRLKAAGVEIVDLGDEPNPQGIVKRTGSTGPMQSVYCRDPDGNLVEISNYSLDE